MRIIEHVESDVPRSSAWLDAKAAPSINGLLMHLAQESKACNFFLVLVIGVLVHSF